LDSFYAQKLDWSECEEAECTSVEVPIDYENPDGGSVKLQVRVIPATSKGGKHLFINPGGPGGSVIGGFEDYMADALGKDVRELYDVVAVDPRGVGSSEPIDCLSDEDLYQLNADDPTPDDQGERTKFDEQWKQFASECREKSGELVDHMTTEETARDFDIVRDALGSKTFDWFGFSYGTRLGATYATLFPNRVGRMVLDGADDPSLELVEATLIQSKGFEVALRAYVQDCVKQESCPLGTEPNAAIRKVSSLLESLDTKPMKTSDADRPLTENLASFGITYPLYDKEAWPDLTKSFAAAMDGNGTPLLDSAHEYFYWQPEEDSFGDNIFEVFPIVLCQDWEERVPAEDAPAHAKRFAKASPVFGESWAWGMVWCGGIPKSDHSQPAIDASESAPIVVIGTTRDPATPFAQSVALANQLGSAVHVTREGDGHGAYDVGSDCIDDLVDAYLASGKVPENKTVCKE
jgi:pimeloyl-ACP methyl ester carboxylesterase